jgi:hypothetical protein
MMNRRSMFGVIGLGTAVTVAPLAATAVAVLSPSPAPLKLWKPVTGEPISAVTMANMIQNVEDAINRLQSRA